MVNLINWSELRKFALLGAHRLEACSTSYWDAQAINFNENMANLGIFTQIQLKKMGLMPEHTVLDIGAGNGRITIPIAKRVKQVTAIEPSIRMLTFLKAKAKKEQISNLIYVNKSWDEVVLGKDIIPHDVVIASFSLFMVDIENALLKIDAAAKKYVYLFLSASKWMDDGVQRIIYDDSTPIESDYIYVYNILHDLGLFGNVEIWDYTSKQSYPDLDAAASKFIELYHIPERKKEGIRAYLHQTLVENDGTFWLNQNKKMAMIWWTKNQCS